jgi:hypothetical protein
MASIEQHKRADGGLAAGWPGSAAGASVDHQRALRVVDGGADSCLAVTGQPA